MARFDMAWFKAQEEKKKAEELAKLKLENPDYKEPEPEKKIVVSRVFRLL